MVTVKYDDLSAAFDFVSFAAPFEHRAFVSLDTGAIYWRRAMLRPSDLLVSVLVITVVVWLNVPKLLVPALVLTILLLSAYRWRRERKEPMAAERYRWRLVASCVVIGAISVPLILKIVPPNGVYGFRTNLTRSSTDIWYAANAFMGWALLVAAIMSAGAVTILPVTAKQWVLLATFLAPLLCAVVASFMYLERLV